MFLIDGWCLFVCGLRTAFDTCCVWPTRTIDHKQGSSYWFRFSENKNNKSTTDDPNWNSSCNLSSHHLLSPLNQLVPHTFDSWCTNAVICRKWQPTSAAAATPRNILLLSISVISNFTATTISSRTCAEQEQQSRRKAFIHTTATTAANYFSNAKQNNKRTTSNNSKYARIPRHNNHNNNISSSTLAKQQQQEQ